MKRGAALSRPFYGALLRKRYLIFAAVLFVLGAGLISTLWLYRLSSRLFPVKEVVFYGNKHLSEMELRSLTGIDENEGLIKLSSAGISKDLLKSPWIKGVSIRKDFPDRVLIKIHEASPFALLELKGRTFFIDDAGRMLEEIKGNTVPFLPIISADPFNRHDDFSEALYLARVVRDKKIATERSRVEIVADKGPENLSMVIDNVVIKVGQGDYEQKIRRLLDLEDEIRRRAVTVDYVDLRFANRVVVKPIREAVK